MSNASTTSKKSKKLSNIENSLQEFVQRNIKTIGVYFLLFILILTSSFFIRVHKAHKMRSYNQQLFTIIETIKNPIDDLLVLYNNNKINQKNRTFVGFALAKAYKKQNNMLEAEKIYFQIFTNEEDQFLKNLAGLNILSLLIEDNSDQKRIEQMYTSLNNNKNSLLDLVKEQYALYNFKNGRKQEAVQLLKSIKRTQINSGLIERISEYQKVYKF